MKHDQGEKKKKTPKNYLYSHGKTNKAELRGNIINLDSNAVDCSRNHNVQVKEKNKEKKKKEKKKTRK